jgi:hypothetical protein
MTQLVDLADEFDLTTAEALEVCHEAGIAAEAGDVALDDDDAARFRSTAGIRSGAQPSDVPPSGAPPPGVSPVLTQVAQTDFSRVPDAWSEASDDIPPPAAGSQGVERKAVLAVVVAAASIAVSLVTGLCGALLAMVPVGLSVRARTAIETDHTSGSGLVFLARVLSVVSIVVGLGVTWIAYSGNLDRLPAMVVLDAFVPGDLRAADALEVGDCVLDPESLPGASELRVVQVVSCSEGHDVEYFAEVGSFGITPVAELDDQFPGDDSVRSVMSVECVPLWEEFVEAPLEGSTLELSVSYPNERAWRSGDRLFLCGVASADGSKLRGSMAGAGR